ncbi:putative mediator of RNA polymerase II transcription subunit 26 [Stomoxys calcitrans]|uniref:MADF domain-containing protein n=1 Tax=Stomoxys calcitrans TaxID=35570 RepID=A0A1I8NUZ4_STOCA|nr:putative mediator of RNA polymerase II transcription subunit 26 [Stomoxys calcitrans]
MANISQLSDLRSYSRHWLGEFIEQYQTEECLWQPKHPDYSNNNVRNKAYDKLVEKLKEVEPNPDRNMVVRKINSLRSAFRREYRKMHSKQNYETRLWYYDKLSFIADQGLKRAITGLGGSSSGSDVKPPKRSLTLAFEDDDSLEFEDEQQLEASSAHSASQTDLQQEQQNLATTITAAVANGEVVPVSIVKSEDHKIHHHHQQQQQQQHVQQHEPPPLHHHHHQQHHQIHTQTQPQHTTAVKVLEITSLDSNSQREIQQAVNSLEQQHHMQQQLQHQQQQQANGAAAAAQLTQIHQQVPTIQIAREHLQPLFGSATAYTTTTSAGNGTRNEDEFDAIGINVASKLRVMNTHQRIIAEKLISDVLFNGQLDNLSVNSHLSQ